MKQTEFVNGVRVFKPFPNAPDFVKFSGIITKKDITEWLKTQKDEIKFVVKESKKGGYYVEVDTFVPTPKVSNSWGSEKFMKDAAALPEGVTDDLPF